MLEGEKVRLRPPTTTDFLREGLWSINPEIRALNPPAGRQSGKTLFSIETLEGKHIGSCTAYDIVLGEAQVGIQIGDKNYWGKGYGTDAMLLLVAHCFYTLGLSRVWLKVLGSNARAVGCYQKCGFTRYGKLALDGYDFVVMEAKRRT